ncbi:MAG: EamA-like transporter family protein [Hyphomicrobiales bacterium]|nr:EamA-like transporter family protein [Hyphomicrobiales bacterium]
MIFAVPAWLWAVFTIGASAAQTARNAMQRDLIATIGTGGATHVRFLFALPFAALFLLVEWLVIGLDLPVPGWKSLAWIVMGFSTQMIATALMLSAMRARSFVVTIAYTKTEPVLIALFGIAFLHETPNVLVALAILTATAGVMLMSWPKARPGDDKGPMDWKPALTGLGAGAFFALSGVGYRGGITSLVTPSFVLAASTTLVIGLVMQTVVILVYLALADRPTLIAIARNWRPSLLAGFMGALASQFWFLAFAISTAAKVRTLALIEVPFAQFMSGRMNQRTSAREFVGMGLIVAGVILLMNG